MAKRKQVKNACTNCQRACKKCDDCRPCSRCIKYGIESTCQDSTRKERTRTSSSGSVLSDSNIPVIVFLAAICSELYISEMNRTSSRSILQPQPQQLSPLSTPGSSNRPYEIDHYRQANTSSPLPRADGILTPPVTPEKKQTLPVVVFEQTEDHLVATVVRSTPSPTSKN